MPNGATASNVWIRSHTTIEGEGVSWRAGIFLLTGCTLKSSAFPEHKVVRQELGSRGPRDGVQCFRCRE